MWLLRVYRLSSGNGESLPLQFICSLSLALELYCAFTGVHRKFSRPKALDVFVFINLFEQNNFFQEYGRIFFYFRASNFYARSRGSSEILKTYLSDISLSGFRFGSDALDQKVRAKMLSPDFSSVRAVTISGCSFKIMAARVSLILHDLGSNKVIM